MLGIIASIVDGVLVGSVYGLAAMGLTLIWGVMDVVNLTHGSMIVAGMFGLYLLTGFVGLNPYAARPPLMSLLSTFAINLVLIGLGTAVWGTVLFNVSVTLPGLSLGRYTFPGTH